MYTAKEFHLPTTMLQTFKITSNSDDRDCIPHFHQLLSATQLTSGTCIGVTFLLSQCRGVNVSRLSTPFRVFLPTILYCIGLHWGQWRFRFFGQKITRPSTYRDQIWTTHTRDKGASTRCFSRMGNSPNSRKLKFLTYFQKFISPKRAKIFFTQFSAFVGVEGPYKGQS